MRTSNFRVISLALIAIIFCSVNIPQLYAQNEATAILINYAEVTPQADGLNLDLFFTIVDNNGRAVLGTSVRSATLLLDEGSPVRYEASTSQPDTPFYVALVLDASGSMVRAANDMRAAAIQAVNNAPENVQFAVFSFNEELQSLTGDSFSGDRNLAINAIGEIKPVDQRGTCLYDAAYQAVELLGSSAPVGRRAVVLFTDGIDQTVDGTPCSTHTSGEVKDLANQSDLHVPIHTIGLRGSNQNPINEADLRDLSSSTGGLSATGDQVNLPELFGQIMNAINGQWLASALVYPQSGLRTATLLVTLDDGTPLRAVTTFETTQGYALAPSPTPTPNLTATPVAVIIEVLGIRTNPEEKVVLIEVAVENDQPVSEYRIELKDTRTNLLQGDGFVYQAPLNSPVRLVVGNLIGGEYSLIVRAISGTGAIIGASEETSFVYTPLPTITPTPSATPTATQPTNTPLPVGASPENIQYLADEQVFRIYLTLRGQEQVNQLRIQFINSQTRQLTGSPFIVSPSETVDISSQGIPGGQYEVEVVSLDSTGNEIALASFPFVHLPATPTPLPSPTATTTPIAVVAVLGAPTVNDNQLVFPVSVQNQDMISRYVLEFVSDDNFVVMALPYDPPPYDQIRVNIEDLALEAGQYKITLKALNGDGLSVADETSISIRYTPQQTASGPESDDENGSSQNPVIILLVIFTLIVGLLFVLYRIMRPKQSKISFLEELTGAQEQREVMPSPIESVNLDPDATNPQVQYDPDATNPVPHLMIPTAQLVIEKSRAIESVGEQITIRHIPFTIGRRDRDLIFEGDDNVSRQHAQITYENGKFFLTDLGSMHGTALNGVALIAHNPTPLPSNAIIRLGVTTQLRFEILEGNSH